MTDANKREENPLGTRPLGPLLFSLAVPAIIANVVNAYIISWISSLSARASGDWATRPPRWPSP